MKLFFKDQTYYLEVTLTDKDGNFVTGKTVTYEIRNSSDGSLSTLPSGFSNTGTMTGDGNVYKVAMQFDTEGQYRVLYFTPTKFENGSELISIENAFAEEDSSQTIITEINANETKIDNITTTLSTLVANIWSYGTRTLTSFGTLVADIWSYTTRTLTSFGTLIADIADQVWDEILSGHLTAGSTGKALDDISAGASPTQIADAVWDELVSGHTTTGSFAELIKKIAGLCKENYRIISPSYDTSDNMTSATIKIYPSASDVDADTNVIATYNVTATYDGQNRMTGYKVKKA